ncbi:hypothetical protein ABGB12_16180 [Actinocorallia sp. B10E7]|uniref:hypothetical protein n=1 Tax=Actinocorallia sp. B10E7 TaxID=3153558 RepID=UPI00325D0131
MLIHLKKLRRGLVAAVVFGALCGAAARLLMRFFTLIGRQVPEFTWGGALGIVVGVTVLYLPGALALSVLRGRWRLLGHAMVAVTVVPHVIQAKAFYAEIFTFFWSTQRWAVYWAVHALYLAVLLACWYGIARMTREHASEKDERASDAVGGDPVLERL